MSPRLITGQPLIEEAWQDVAPDQRPGVLLAFPFYRQTNMDDLLGPIREAGVRVFADSGAFSAWRTGKTVDLDEYAAWLQRWGHLFDITANLDVIGDADGTAANHARLEAAGLNPLPTLHYGVPWSVFDASLARRPDYIGLGGMVGRMTYEHTGVMRWAVAAFKRANAIGAKVHGYGVTRWNAIWDLPWQSVDSTTWHNGGRYGSLLLFTGKRLFQARATQLCDNLPAIRATGFDLQTAYKGVVTIGRGGDHHVSRLIALRSIARAQEAVRRRHRRPDFTIYCAAVL